MSVYQQKSYNDYVRARMHVYFTSMHGGDPAHCRYCGDTSLRDWPVSVDPARSADVHDWVVFLVLQLHVVRIRISRESGSRANRRETRGRRIMPAEFRAESGIFRDWAEGAESRAECGRLWQGEQTCRSKYSDQTQRCCLGAATPPSLHGGADMSLVTRRVTSAALLHWYMVVGYRWAHGEWRNGHSISIWVAQKKTARRAGASCPRIEWS